MRTYILRLLGLMLLAGSMARLQASSTSGATTRAINTGDGIVTTGATPGSNGVDWELDEVFQGFSGAVDWYLSWDDNNLYLGRVGGNNAEGSIVYLQADYTGAAFANRAFNYDALQPEASAMGGVNFAAYFKSSAHEFRTYNGSAWSAATANTLTPSFTTQSTGDNMEVAIPWSAITAGNGRPTRIRFVLYQVAPAGMSCGQEFVYGESPWGTGNVSDGPSVGVNDGMAMSQRQPGGCAVGADTLRRWWGCYPVIGGVGGSAWTFEHNFVSVDSNLCMGTSSYAISGDGGSGLGSWMQVSGPATATFGNSSNATTTVSNLSAQGQYVFVFTRAVTCETVHDTVIYHLHQLPAFTLGSDTTICQGSTICLSPSPNATLVSYAWSNGSSGATLCVSTAGTYALLATDTRACSSSDTVQVSLMAQPQITQVVVNGSQCPIFHFSLQIQGNATGYDWNLSVGNHLFTATPTFDYTALGNGNYPLQVVVTNACGTDTAQAMVVVNCLTAMEASLANGLQHAPNPSHDLVRVALPSDASEIMQVQVLDLGGRSMPAVPMQTTGHAATLDLSALAVGTYYVILQLADGSHVGFIQMKQ